MGGVRFFDTAQAYGDSEEVLGRSLSAVNALQEARVITKTDPAHEPLFEELRRSLKRTGVSRLWGVLLHRETQLDEWEHGIGRSLLKARDKGMVKHLGVSVYAVERALQAIRLSGIDILQVATSVFDRRMIRAGVFARAAEAGKTVFVRSIYLQGLVLMEPAAVPARFGSARKAVTRFVEFCARRNLSRGRVAASYVLQRAPGTMVVVGAETPAQVCKTLRFLREGPVPSGVLDEWDAEWPCEDESFINPQEWPKS